MTSPTNRPTPSDDELAARLRGTFQRSEARAAHDPATPELVAAAIAGSRRHPPAWSAFAVVAAAVVIVVVGVATLQKPIGPAPVGGSGAVPSGVPQSSSPALSASPDLTTIFPVGSGAEAQVANSGDDTPFLVSGWLLGTSDRYACSVSPAPPPNLDPCRTLQLRPAADGGRALDLYQAEAARTPAPDLGMALPVVLRVRTHDPECLEPSCRQLPVMVSVESVGQAVPIPAPTSTEPPNGLDAAGAEAAATAWASAAIPGYDLVRSAVAGPYGAIVAAGSDVAADRWVWAVTLATGPDASASTYLVVIDYVTGELLYSTSPAPELSPAAGPDSPLTIGGQRVLGHDDARTAILGSANTPILVGGWLLGADRRLCAAGGSTVPLEAAWNPCAGAWLHSTAAGGNPIALYNLAGVTVPSVPEDEALPVVFRVHTHDPAATGGDVLLPVIEEVAWTGTPTSGAVMGEPTGGTSAAMAGKVALGLHLHTTMTTVRFTAAITLTGLEATTGTRLSGPGTTPDSWVWVVVLTDGSVPARSAAVVVVDMKTGKFLSASSSYP